MMKRNELKQLQELQLKINDFYTLVMTTKNLDLCNLSALLEFLGINWGVWVNLSTQRDEFNKKRYEYITKANYGLRMALNELLGRNASYDKEINNQGLRKFRTQEYFKRLDFELANEQKSTDIEDTTITFEKVDDNNKLTIKKLINVI
ncbi:conserved hypothetical protein [Ureaplasma parvum serovar 3 str. ATCC 27815]|uniref:Uncharacterized protein UU170 n=3 Tax=Ureaplasma parvum serovar 3 TaxID=38504 RepID=Y170_UREPA|nr:hypothetical protein [Ureaplasma parvum]Q9PQX3.1 RecName: Full=Uncharacterized protein UU170 [Ureaplasma parvum serovar 3 str. ATCC 700970]pir/E82923/ hypothetical protein UU170 [imported] - Ureaplasma urealyticum [Ureaplasma urealyticum]AAF30577.1 unique hypothetical [Ureaplasma parvum serovar 3 str. ATCC 700970]ACA32840.1 conserved hypothetical protein [Ureaplasma parvum serovar 3 str. ATCC 27815]